MNIHHLELFYYVARFGGISEAVRNIPYGIQQPAMSGQIIQLEESLGVTLFQRRPFSLTPPGDELYGFIKPFFDNLQAVEDKLRGASQHVVIGASDVILRDYLPSVLEAVRKQFPDVRVTLRTGYQVPLQEWVQKQELDLAITLLEGRPAAGLQTQPLLDLPLSLLVRKNSGIRSAEQLWQMDRIEEALISLPPTDAICKNFQKGLGRLGVDWFTGIEVSSFELIEAYVENGYGIGLSVAIPDRPPGPGIRALSLPEFPPVTLGVVWHGKANPLVEAFLKAIQQRARQVV